MSRTVKEIKYDNADVKVEVANRDSDGNIIKNTYEKTSNKATIISSASTNDQYPSALATYNAITNHHDSTKQDALTAGDGIDITNNAISVDLANDGGLEISQDKLRVDDTIATKTYVDDATDDMATQTWVNAKGYITDISGKLDKNTSATYSVYGVTSAGTQTMFGYGQSYATGNTIAMRDSGGRLVIGTPTANTHATTKKYVDDADTALDVRVQNLEARGRYLSGWNCTTGKPNTYPPVPSGQTSYTYTYKTGDYFVVTNATTGSATSANKKPSGTTVSTTDGGTTWTISSVSDGGNVIAIGDYYIYDGNGTWNLIHVDTNTHRPIQMNGTEILGNNVTPLNLVAGQNITLSNSSGTVTVATDTAIPTKTSDLTNDSGFLTSHQDISGLLKLDGSNTMTGMLNLKASGANEGNIGTNGIRWNSTSLPQFSGTIPYFLGIESFASGGQTKWQTASSIKISTFDNDAGYLTSHQSLANYVTTNTYQTITKPKVIKGVDSDDGTDQPALLKVLNTNDATTTSGWQGRIMAGSKNKTFLLGTYRDMCGIGAHSWTDSAEGTGAAWENFYLNPDGNKAVVIGYATTGWSTSDTGILKIDNSDHKAYYKGNELATQSWVTSQGYLTSHQSLANYVTLDGEQTISGKKTFTGSMKVSGRYNNAGDDEGIIVGTASNNYAGLCLGNPSGERSVFYLCTASGSKKAFWRYNNGSNTYDLQHPEISGTIATTSYVQANPSDEATSNISKIKIGSTVYNISGGSGGGLPTTGGVMTGNITFSNSGQGIVGEEEISVSGDSVSITSTGDSVYINSGLDLEITTQGSATLNGSAIATTTDLSDKLSKTEQSSISVAGTTKNTTVLGGNTLVAPNGLVMSGTAASAGLVTRGICGVTSPSGTGACSKDNLFINYDSVDTYNTGRQMVLQAGSIGTHYGNNLYQYCVPRGDIVKAWVEAKGYLTGTKFNANNPNTFIGYNNERNEGATFVLTFKNNDNQYGLTHTPFAIRKTSSSTPSGATENGFYYVSSGESGLSGANANPFLQYHSEQDFRILTTAYNDQWIQQIATDFRSNKIFFRRKQNDTWQDWRRIDTDATHRMVYDSTDDCIKFVF